MSAARPDLSEQPVTHELLAELRQRADAEHILRDGDPFYGDDGEASAFERTVTPAVVHSLVDEIERLQAALSGHLFDGESLSTRERVRAEFISELTQGRNHHRATGVRVAARIYSTGLRESITRGEVCAFLSVIADDFESAGGAGAATKPEVAPG
jgi:hypothetical protein